MAGMQRHTVGLPSGFATRGAAKPAWEAGFSVCVKVAHEALAIACQDPTFVASWQARV